MHSIYAKQEIIQKSIAVRTSLCLEKQLQYANHVKCSTVGLMPFNWTFRELTASLSHLLSF